MRKITHTQHGLMVPLVGTLFSNQRRQTNPFVYQSVSRHLINQPHLIPLTIMSTREKLLKDRQIMDENMVNTFPSKANRTGNMNDFIPGIIKTTTMRSGQPTTNKSTPSMWPWEWLGKPWKKAAPIKIPLSSTHLTMVSSVALTGMGPRSYPMKNPPEFL